MQDPGGKGASATDAPTPQQWQRISNLVEIALELDRPLRSAWLQTVKGRDAALVSQVRQILEGLGAAPTGGGKASSVETDPERIGAYRLVELIGRGGMGAVYLAERVDQEFEHQVAIKLVAAGLDAPIVHQRFLAERQILARFDHPHIARLYEGGTTADGRPYFVLEYVQGTPIDRYCNERKLDLEARLELFLKVCDAVAYAHRNLVVHRDLKPGNILVDRAGSPKLLDFGIAKVLDPSSMPFELEATRTAQRPMTPGYASPEQVGGKPITTATDVYSLGVLLYKLLTGELPHAFPNLAPTAMLEVLRRAPGSAAEMLLLAAKSAAASEAPQFGDASPAQTARRVAGDLDNILAKTLRFEPEARYLSVTALADDLRRFLAGENVQATRGSAVYRLRKAVRRYRWPLLVVASLLAISIGWSLVLSRQVAATTKERDRAQATRDFLVDLLRSADAEERSRQTVPLAELLDQGLTRLLDEQNPLDRGARIDLLEVLGNSLNQFFDIGRALEAYTKALELTDPAASATRARLLEAKGKLELATGRSDDAVESWRQALREIPEDETEVRARLFSQLAVVAEQSLQTAAALEGFRGASRAMGEKLASDHAVFFLILRNWVFVMDRNQEALESENLAKRAYSYFAKELGADAIECYFFAGWIGTIEHGRGNGDTALPAYREARRVLEINSHSHAPGMLWLLDGLAGASALLGDEEEAFRFQDEGVEKLKRLYEVESGHLQSRLSEIHLRIGRLDILRRFGRTEEIPAQATRILTLLDEGMPEVDSQVALQRGIALAFLGRREEAVPLIENGIRGGWAQARSLAIIDGLGLLPEPMPKAEYDFTLPVEVEKLLAPYPAETPLPWEEKKD